VDPERHHDLHDTTGWQQESQCVASRIACAGVMAGLDYRGKGLGLAPNEYCTLDRIHQKSLQMETRVNDELLIENIKSMLHLNASNSLVPHGIGNHARDLLEASVATIDRLRAENAALRHDLERYMDIANKEANENKNLEESVTSQALLIASLKEEHFETLFKINKQYMRLMNSYIFERFGGDSETLPDEGFEQEVLDRIVPALTQQLSVNQGQNVKLKESIVQKNSDISSWVERDFANQRKIADLMQRVGKTETDNL
jgi:hypothetical protein